MREFSFFYKPGTAGYVRGKQMADYLKGKHNPKSGFENDTCIYVKTLPPDKPPKHTYMDVDDAPKAVEWLKTHPEVGVIAVGITAYFFLRKELNRDDIYIIPHQHCNFERWIRPIVRDVETVGIIGSKTSFQHPIEDLRKRLDKIGLKLSYEADYWKNYSSSEEKEGRIKVCDFYKTVDIQVVWRPKTKSLWNPNKLGNAASFGIPTISYPEPSYVAEWHGAFIPVETIDEMIAECKKMKEDEDYYNECCAKSWNFSQKYFIIDIGQLYKDLP